MRSFKLLLSLYYTNLDKPLKYCITELKSGLNEIQVNPYRYLKYNNSIHSYIEPNKIHSTAELARSIIKEPTEIKIYFVIWSKYGSNRSFIITKDSIKYSRNKSYE